VANAFFRAGEIEAGGRGIQRIFAACREAETPEPRILYEPGDMWFEFPHSAAYLEIIPGGAGRRGLGEEAGERVGEKVGETSGKTSGKILASLIANPDATIPELARMLGITDRSIERNLRQLRQQRNSREIGDRPRFLQEK